MQIPLRNRRAVGLDRIFERFTPSRTTTRLAVLLLAALLLVAIWWLVWNTGGTRGPYLHAAYLPILLTAVALGLLPAVGAAVVGTILLGPLMPLDVEEGLPQATSAWLFRGVFFVAIGGFVGYACGLLQARAERNDQLRQDLASTYSRNLRVFAGLVERRDEQTYGHCDRVARNSVAIGRRLGLDARDLGCLYWAGLLHDLGKIGVPEAILRKPGKLTAQEFDEVKKHCELGRTILLNVSDDYAPIAAGVLSHHERWDGAGYPEGLAGVEIPVFGRIVAVADVFEALTSHRPYRDPMTQEEALSVLEEGRGRHFDPAVLEAFLAALEDDEIGHECEDPLATQAFVHAILRPEAIGTALIDDRAPWRARVST